MEKHIYFYQEFIWNCYLQIQYFIIQIYTHTNFFHLCFFLLLFILIIPVILKIKKIVLGSLQARIS